MQKKKNQNLSYSSRSGPVKSVTLQVISYKLQ